MMVDLAPFVSDGEVGFGERRLAASPERGMRTSSRLGGGGLGASVISSERIERLQVALAAGEVAELAFREPQRLRARLVRILGAAAGNHAANVRRLAVRLAQRLEVPESSVASIALGSVLHDAGKLCVPEAILAKPAPLTDAEWSIVRRHPVAGEKLLEPFVHSDEVLSIIRFHHERWDGRGYPDGRAQAEIPLAARVVGTADAYEAMTEPRPYRLPRSKGQALSEITAHSGSQFDPDCALALSELIRDEADESASNGRAANE
jgi:HD-GYP domain-containing protein (c-di-GMP phosphodiesterase class II)